MQHPRKHRRRRAVLAATLATAALIAAGLTALNGAGTAEAATARQVEALDRGVVSVHTDSGNLVSWRWLGTDPDNVSFNVYRAGTKVNSTPITGPTNYFHSGAPEQADYTVRAVVGGVEQSDSVHAIQFRPGYKDVPISPPAGGTTPDGVAYTYEANDASIGDLDGDGALDIVLKWQPTNAKDNSRSGYTGNTIVDGIKLDGTRLWRIDLGRNIRSGAHYTQFQVYDYDGDGKAEVAMKTADGTKDGTGALIGSSSADHRNSSGYILTGPEYLTMFNGQTGKAMGTVDYVPARGTVSSWGDSYGNRVDRFLAGTAYLDGSRPSLIMARGYYTRTVIAAWDWRNGAFTRRWTFDTNSSTNSAKGVRRPGLAQPVRRGRRRRRQGRDRVRRDGRRRQRQRPVDHEDRPRRRPAPRRPRPLARGPGVLQGLGVHEPARRAVHQPGQRHGQLEARRLLRQRPGRGGRHLRRERRRRGLVRLRHLHPRRGRRHQGP